MNRSPRTRDVARGRGGRGAEVTTAAQFSFSPPLLFPSALVCLLICWLFPTHLTHAQTRGMVASVNPLATEAGLNILKSGGNAIDAAVAVGFTLGVVDTHNSGIG